MMFESLRPKCVGCRKHKWFARPRKIMMPIGIEAHQRDPVCGPCFRRLRARLK